MGWLEDYLAGEHEPVWAAMRAAGPGIRDDPTTWRAARAVARETMLRVRHNVEHLRAALVATGYEFQHPEWAHVVPGPDVARRFDDLEAAVGPIALSLRAFAEVVGTVDFTGRHPDWTEDRDLVDPFYVGIDPDSIASDHADWRFDGLSDDAHPGRFPTGIAPDALHKANISGDGPSVVWLPDGGADPIWYLTSHDAEGTGPFVEGLRGYLLNNGGFCLFESAPAWMARVAPGLRPF